MKIAHVSTFPAMRCGIAIYAADLVSALASADNRKYALHYGTNKTPDALAHADVSNPDNLRELGKTISRSDCDVLCVQHEFGIWGGGYGQNIFAFLEQIRKPMVSTLHTTFEPGTRHPTEEASLRALITRSNRVVVLTEASTACMRKWPESAAKLVVIPHGVPEIGFRSPPTFPARSIPSRAHCKLISVGFYRRDKGFEDILLALWLLERKGYTVEYTIAGEPQRQFDGQTTYLADLRNLTRALGLEHRVSFIDRFLTVSEQVELIQSCHAGVFAYQTPIHASSGAVPLVLASGRPVICTPFEYARSKRSEIAGVIVAKDFGAEAIADAIISFIEAAEAYPATIDLLYDQTRAWCWTNAGGMYRIELYHAMGRLCRPISK